MSEQKKRPLWPLLTAALIGLPVLYVLGVGPALWLLKRSLCPVEVITVGYAPVLSVAERGPQSVKVALWWWCRCFDSDHVLEQAVYFRMDSRIHRGKGI